MKSSSSNRLTRFNTQPPEGGWSLAPEAYDCAFLFQHTAARRRLGQIRHFLHGLHHVSTHSRPKAAGLLIVQTLLRYSVSTHSRPKAAGKV